MSNEGSTADDPNPPAVKTTYSSDHELSEFHRSRGTSDVESLALRIEQRHQNRHPVPAAVRARLVRDCEKISPVRITLQELLDYKAKIQKEVDAQNENCFTRAYEWLGFRNHAKVLLAVLEKATTRVTEELQYDLFYYQDYAFYFTRLENRWPFMRNPMLVTITSMLLFFVGTGVLFCPILNDSGVCPRNTPYAGWLTAIYFASTTMSTVGYGDVSVFSNDEHPDKWRVFIGAIYMLVALLVAILAFSSAVDAATEPLGQSKPVEMFFDWVWGKRHWNHKHRLRRMSFIKLGAIAFQFTVVNLIGIFFTRIFVHSRGDKNPPEDQWNWMESFYWAIQTTTTIGYGDLNMPYQFRWFQTFYLLLSTYFVADALGKVGSYFSEMEALRRLHAWRNREVSRGMIEDWQAEEHDDRIDQYEFAIASLVNLGKVSHSDLKPIMDQFRKLAGTKGSISVDTIKAIEMKSLRKIAVEADEEEESDEENNSGEGGETAKGAAVTAATSLAAGELPSGSAPQRED